MKLYKACAECFRPVRTEFYECPDCGHTTFMDYNFPLTEEDARILDTELELIRNASLLRESTDPTSGSAEELDVDLPEDPEFCNHLTRNNTLCKVKKPCGYHSSDVQKRQEESLKQTIVEIINEEFDSDISLSDFPLDARCPAYDLLKHIIKCTDPKTLLQDPSNCEHNFTMRIDGVVVCTLCGFRR